MENFINVESFKTECSVLVKHLYLVYFLCGAICYNKYVRFKFRCFLVGFLLVAYFCCTIPPLKELIQHSTLRYTFINVGFLSYIHFSVLLILGFFRKKTEFYRLFDIIEKTPEGIIIEVDEENAGNYLKENNILKIHYKVNFCLISFCFFLFFGKLFASPLFYDDYEVPYKVDRLWEFFIPFFCDNCNTSMSYFWAYVSSYFMATYYAITHIGALVLFFIISLHLKNHAIVLQNSIRFHSDSVRQKLEKCWVDEEKELNKDRPNDFKLRSIVQQRERHVEEYMLKVHRWIKIHQRFMEFANQYQICGKAILEFEFSYCSFSIVIFGYFIASSVMDDENVGIEFSLYMIKDLMTLLICCHLGNALKYLSGMISEAVYATPWYYLPAKEQKVILNFLTLAQRDQEIRLFGIIKLNLERFPVILNDAYGYIQIMYLLISREKN